MKTWGLLAVVVISGCASSIVSTGKDTYIVTKKSPACGFSSAEGTKVSLYKKANAYCAKEGKQIETIEAVTRDGVPFVRCASAELHFRCVSENPGD